MLEQRRIGLARALSKLGCCSRFQAAALIRDGRVVLNRLVERNPESPVRLPQDSIEVDGVPVKAAGFVYFMMNKPRGVVTTASDEKQRDTVYRYLPTGTVFVGPVGRLDKASEGLILLTNDSEWAGKITDPSTHLEKIYHVQVNCVADESLIARITAHASNVRGSDFRAKSARLLRHGRKNSWLEITLDEGKNRQIRRLLETAGVEVMRLVRISIGPLQLGNLAKGSVRQLTLEEKAATDRVLLSRL